MPTYANLSGPLFDGRADMAAEAAVQEIAKDVAHKTKDIVDAILPNVLKFPTGNYQAHIQQEARGPATHAVNDGGRIVYGPWLEGVGSRNFPKTRFKGYFTFRNAHHLAEVHATDWAGDVLSKYVRRMS